MKVFKNGLLTWLLLQFAVGPVFFFIINLTLQRSALDGLMWVLAVTIVDYLYIVLAVFGIWKLLEKQKIKKLFWIISAIVLILFWVIMIKNIITGNSNNININSTNLISSFLSVFFLTLSSPMTIIFFTSLFATKAIEYKYTKRDLFVFWLSTGLATFLFMWISVFLFSAIRGNISIMMVSILNLVVGCLLVCYGIIRFINILKKWER